ncbi:glucose 1-dehydrogenase [Bacillaceae bacterium Marseille-Q3522]|nr:glucose 1-dehydrogenase [Bacillaceae bacterium Marseille-Q3522]
MSSLFDLTNKTAIVTGGGRGLGEIMACALAEAHANVVVCSRNFEACQKVRDQIIANGGKALAFQCDITNQEDIDVVITETVKHFGTIDILVNNSGTSWIAPMLDYPGDKWDKVMNVNLKAAFLFSQAAAKVMKTQRCGKIIFISSVTGLFGTDPAFLDAIAYNTSKGALVTLTKEMAVKLAADNIQVNSIAPGLFPSKITKALESVNSFILAKIPAKRFGEKDDLAGAIVFFSSRASDYITGQTLVMDGGLTAGI